MNHSIIPTGGNIHHDYISDFDNSGRVIVLTCRAIHVFANDRAYQLDCDPLISAYGCNNPDEGEADESDEGFATITNGLRSISVKHTADFELTVILENNDV